jgi:hypothetical protein
MFTGATPAEAFAEKDNEHATPCHFWCNLTQTVVGPDDRPAHKDTCESSRACFEE